MSKQTTNDKRLSTDTAINESIICAGFGGQGVMVLGKFLAAAGMSSGFNVTWLPAYGAEVRGGTAHSYVRISSSAIGSPAVSHPGTAIIMNGPSLDKFEKRVDKGGLIILNTSMCDRPVGRKDLEVAAVPLTDEAIALGSIKVANIIAAGIYAAKKGIFTKDILLETIEVMAGERKEIIPVNIKAIERGWELGLGA